MCGRYNSSLTRVQPFFEVAFRENEAGWLQRLLACFDSALATEMSATAGLLPTEIREISGRKWPNRAHLEACFEKKLPPPVRFLRWLIEHPELMPRPKDDAFATNEDNNNLRKQLFGLHGRELQQDALQQALANPDRFGSDGSDKQWWAFEGFTHVDFYLETERCIFCFEGKRTEDLTGHVAWWPTRNQLVRNLEVVREQAMTKGKEYAVVLLAENAPELDLARISDESLPHLDPAERDDLMTHYLGCLTWRAACEETGIDYDNDLPETTEE